MLTEEQLKYCNMMRERLEHQLNIIVAGYALFDEKIDFFHQEAKDNRRLTIAFLRRNGDEG